MNSDLIYINKTIDGILIVKKIAELLSRMGSCQDLNIFVTLNCCFKQKNYFTSFVPLIIKKISKKSLKNIPRIRHKDEIRSIKPFLNF